jgi:hypothetical protein
MPSTLSRGALACALAILASQATAQTRIDASGTIAPSVGTAGSLGKDYSANQPPLPNVGSNFGSTGPWANYVLIETVPINPARFNIDIENISGAQIVIMRDDGTASSGAAPLNASVFALAGGAAAGAQGGSWSSQTFKGRLQIYAATSTAQVAVMGD